MGTPSVKTITEAELFDALAAAAGSTTESPDEARTTAELAVETGLHIDKVRDALRVFQQQGRLTIHKVRRHSLDGRLAKVVGYTIAPEEKRRG